MFIHYLRQFCLCLALFILTNNAFADIYKWMDKQGDTHYSQSPPKEQNAELITMPPPPAIDHAKAQQELNQLITQQVTDRHHRLQQQNQAKQAVAQEATRKQNCTTAQRNLQQYQDNSGRRFIDLDGNIAHLKEEERQQKINDYQQYTNKFCT